MNQIKLLFLLLVPCIAFAQSIDMEAFHIAAERPVNWTSPDYDADLNNLVHAKILGFNDFHGYLNEQYINDRPIGGATLLATYLKRATSDVEGNAIIVHAGDIVGASPPLSSLKQDEPTIEFLNLLGNDNCQRSDVMNPACNVVGTLGNHEFDEGPDEMRRLLFGGQHERSSGSSPEWKGASFPYVSANAIEDSTDGPIIPPYVIKEIDGIRVAVIGALLKEAKEVVAAGMTEGVTFVDEATAVNHYVAELKAMGIEAIILTIHQGFPQNPLAEADGIPANPVTRMVNAIDDEVDVILMGHTHTYTNMLIPGLGGGDILVAQAFEEGRAFSDIDILLDRNSGDIVSKTAAIRPTWGDQGVGLAPDREIQAFINELENESAQLLSQIIGVTTGTIGNREDNSGQAAAGNLFADATRFMLGTDFAMAGVSGARGTIEPGPVTFADIYRVYPFNNEMTVMSLTGDQIRRLLNRQWAGRQEPEFLAVAGISYRWDPGLPNDNKVLEIVDEDNEPLVADQYYRVAVPGFYDTGGNGFAVFNEGIDREVHRRANELLVDYIRTLPNPFEVTPDTRMVRVDDSQ